MRSRIVHSVVLAVAAQFQVANACGLTVSRHLADGDTAAVSKLLTAANSETRRQLDSLVDELGELSSLSEARAPRFENFRRLTVQSPEFPSDYRSSLERVDATSTNLGSVQVEVHTEIGSTCSVLAIHVDFA